MARRRQKKSGLLMTMGVLSIVFGVLGLICGALGAGSNLLVKSLAQQNNPGGAAIKQMLAFMDREVPYWVQIEVGKAGLVALLSGLVLIAGVGLIGHKRWARPLAIFYGVAMLILQLAYAGWELGVVLPAIERWQKTQPFGAGGSNPGTMVGVVVGLMFWIAFSLALLVSMLMPAAGDALRDKPARRPAYEDEDDDYDDRRRDDDDDDYDDRPRGRRRSHDDDYDDDDTRYRARD